MIYKKNNDIIGIIGLGIIGNANKYGFEKNKHTVIGHDIKLNTNIIFNCYHISKLFK